MRQSNLLLVIAIFSLTTSFSQSSIPLNDSRCRPFNISSRGYFDANAEANLGTSNPDQANIRGTNRGATSEIGEVFGSASGATGKQQTVWYEMTAPTCGANSIRFSTSHLRTNFDTRISVYNRVILDDCTGRYEELASNNDDYLGILGGKTSTIEMPQGSGLRRSNTFSLGQKLFIQLSGSDGATGNYGLIVDVNSPNISIGTVGTSEVEVLFPIAELASGPVAQIAVRYRVTGSDPSTYSEVMVAGTASSYNLTGLSSGTSYDIWVVYRCAAGDNWVSQKEMISTALPSPPRVPSLVITPIDSVCNAVIVSWLTGSEDATYTLYYTLAGAHRAADSIVIAAPASMLNTGPVLLPAANYIFWMKTLFRDGTTNSTAEFVYTTCGAMARMEQETPASAEISSDIANAETDANTATNENAKANITEMDITPNPAIDETNISYEISNTSNPINIKMFSIDGKEMYQDIISSPSLKGTYHLSLEQFGAGIYFVQIETNGTLQSKKLIVK